MQIKHNYNQLNKNCHDDDALITLTLTNVLPNISELFGKKCINYIIGKYKSPWEFELQGSKSNNQI